MGFSAKILLDDDTKGRSVFRKLKKSFFENDDDRFAATVKKLDGFEGIEEMLSEELVKTTFAKLTWAYDGKQAAKENIVSASKTIFAKGFHDMYISNNLKLDKATEASFDVIDNFMFS